MARERARRVVLRKPSALGAEDRRAIARGEMLAWLERVLAAPDVTMPDALRAEGEELVAGWKWRREP